MLSYKGPSDKTYIQIQLPGNNKLVVSFLGRSYNKRTNLHHILNDDGHQSSLGFKQFFFYWTT